MPSSEDEIYDIAHYLEIEFAPTSEEKYSIYSMILGWSEYTSESIISTA